MMTMSVETITPETAAAYLRQNEGNRRMRSWWVKVLAQRIRRGEWVLSHQGVAFDTDGKLRDGQHRLHAIIESGIPCLVAVFRGVDVNAFRVMDQGVKRAMADIAGLDRRVVDPCGMAAAICYGSSYSFDQIEPILSSRIGETAIDLVAHSGTMRRLYSSAGMKLGCIINAMKGAREREYAFNTYRALVNLDFPAMSLNAQALVRQEQSGKVATLGKGQADVLARALAVFDLRKAQNTRIVVDADAAAAATKTVRHLVSAEIAGLNEAA